MAGLRKTNCMSYGDVLVTMRRKTTSLSFVGTARFPPRFSEGTPGCHHCVQVPGASTQCREPRLNMDTDPRFPFSSQNTDFCDCHYFRKLLHESNWSAGNACKFRDVKVTPPSPYGYRAELQASSKLGTSQPAV